MKYRNIKRTTLPINEFYVGQYLNEAQAIVETLNSRPASDADRLVDVLVQAFTHAQKLKERAVDS